MIVRVKCYSEYWLLVVFFTPASEPGQRSRDKIIVSTHIISFISYFIHFIVPFKCAHLIEGFILLDCIVIFHCTI